MKKQNYVYSPWMWEAPLIPSAQGWAEWKGKGGGPMVRWYSPFLCFQGHHDANLSAWPCTSYWLNSLWFTSSLLYVMYFRCLLTVMGKITNSAPLKWYEGCTTLYRHFFFPPGKYLGQTQQRSISQHAPPLVLKLMEAIMAMKLFKTVKSRRSWGRRGY